MGGQADPESGSVEPELGSGFEEDGYVPVFMGALGGDHTEAVILRGLLEAAGIPCSLAGRPYSPLLPLPEHYALQVRVPPDRLEEARRLIAEARAAGPDAAEEAERWSERQTGHTETKP